MSIRIHNFMGRLGWELQKRVPNLSSNSYLTLQFMSRRRSQKEYIDYKIGITHFDYSSGSILHYGCDTGHAAADKVIGYEEKAPSKHIAQNSEGDDKVLLDTPEKFVL